MASHFGKPITRFILPLLLLTLACSSVTNISSPAPESTYVYDDLSPAGAEDAPISAYSAISRWNKLDIAYFFINGTDKLQSDSEREVVRQAFDLWTQTTPLTFTEVSSQSQADIVIGWASGEPTLLPQTITIQKLNSGWFITQVNFFGAPAFCN